MYICIPANASSWQIQDAVRNGSRSRRGEICIGQRKVSASVKRVMKFYGSIVRDDKLTVTCSLAMLGSMADLIPLYHHGALPCRRRPIVYVSPS